MKREDYKALSGATVKEEDVQQMIMQYLGYKGYTVLQTSHRNMRFQCPTCRTLIRNPRGYGSSFGVPDLLISSTKWPAGMMLGIEVKGPKTRLSNEQKELLALKRIFIARSIDDADLIVKEFEASFTKRSA